MGLLAKKVVKQLLKELFPECFLKEGDFPSVVTSVDTHIVDLNLDTHNIQHLKLTNSKEALEKALLEYPPDRFKCFPNCTTLIGTMDDSRLVPKAKRIEQATRDERNARAGLLLDYGELKRLGKHAHITQQDASSVEHIYRFMRFKLLEDKKDETFRKLDAFPPTEKAGDTGLTYGEQMRVYAYQYFLNLLMNTRSTRKEVLQFAAHHYLDTPRGALTGGRKIVYDGIPFPRPKGKVKISLDAEWIHQKEVGDDAFDDILGSYNQLWVDPNCLKEADFFERETIPVQVVKTEGELFIQLDEGTATMGEGDIKMVYHAIQEALGSNSGKRKVVWVACADTDLIVIMLLSLYTLVQQRPDSALEEVLPQIYLDYTNSIVHPISDKQEPREYYNYLGRTRNVIDLKKLYIRVDTVFKAIWPEMNNPILCLCMLFMSVGTDYFNVKGYLIGEIAVLKTFFAGGYAILDAAVTLEYVDYADSEKGERVPIVTVDENKMFDFLRYSYAVTKLTRVKKNMSIAGASFDMFNKLVLASTSIVRTIAPPRSAKKRKIDEVPSGASLERTAITSAKRTRTEISMRRGLGIYGGTSTTTISTTIDDLFGSSEESEGDQVVVDGLDRTPVISIPAALEPMLPPSNFSSKEIVNSNDTGGNLLGLDTPAMLEWLQRDFIYSDSQLERLCHPLGKTPLLKRAHAISICRRWAWNIFYWILASRYSLDDVSVCTAPNKRSIFGFSYDVESNTSSLDDVYTIDT